ncbi:MAG: ABC transporter ATP-binding protein [Phycisphaerales bacterium]|nr:ABC transporter ATP-binding protein [Planctomycetota bacterium]MCH8508450.1 ABC transporter ATP-binding protein [Phycisphaerales bacterium]
MSSEVRREEDIAVSCAGVGKAYRIYDRPHHRLLELLGLRHPDKSGSFWAVRGVDLTVRCGECVAIVGRNGAGKSTLLEMIAGTTRPTEGVAGASGRVAALLAMGTGFNPELTGRENIHLNAAVLGLTTAESRERFDAIVAFSGLGEHIERPVRTYSRGMSARLAFSVAAHVDADVLIIDETLAVGDGMFVQKCMRWVRSFRRRGTLLFVSHATHLVVDLCDRAVWLEDGRVVEDGPAKEVVRAYSASIHRNAVGDDRIRVGRGIGSSATPGPAPEPTPAPPEADEKDVRSDQIERLGLKSVMENMRLDHNAGWWGREGARVVSARLLDADGRPAAQIETGGRVTIELTCVAEERLEHPVVGYVVRNRHGIGLFADNSWLAYGPDGSPPVEAGSRFVTRFDIRFPHLPAGEYALGGAVADGKPREFIQHHRVDDLLLFRVPVSHLIEGLVGATMLGCEMQVTDPAIAREAAP